MTGAALPVTGAWAETIPVAQGQSAVEALARAAPGDTIHLAAGTFQGNLLAAVPGVTIEGDPGAVVEGSGNGDAIRLPAADVTIRGLRIRGSGLTLIDKNSGVFLDRTADRAQVTGNQFEENLISIYLDGPHDVVVRGNHIEGLRTLRRTER